MLRTPNYAAVERSTIAALMVAFLLMFVSLPRSKADDRAKCQARTEKAEARRDEAIRDHGEHSREADARRADLRAERQHCWDAYHQWWNGKDKQWHKDRDWDHDDHPDHP